MNHFLILFTFLLHGSSLGYKAGVVEFYPLSDDTPQDTILKNLNNYKSWADAARNQAVDILVFPEYGLTKLPTQNFDPKEYAIEINQSQVIKELQAMAIEREMYIVVNLLEKVQDGGNSTLIYNTDLVFDRDGKIIVQYRKINFDNEWYLTPGEPNQNATFTTDFGVTFGIFTGLDIFFKNPSTSLLEDCSVTDVIYLTSLVSTMPFQISTTIQHGYSQSQRVNLLASNYGNPRQGHGGSGIYLSDGSTPKIYIDGSPSSKLIVTEIRNEDKRPYRRSCASNVNSNFPQEPFGLPGNWGGSNIDNYMTNTLLPKHVFEKIDLNHGDVSAEVCYENFCCTFNISVETNTNETYKLIAINRPTLLADKSVNVKICSLLVCQDESDEKCWFRKNATTRFRKITVTGNLAVNGGGVYYPLTLNYNLQPLVSSVFCDSDNSTGSINTMLTTSKDEQSVLVFGLFAAVAGGNSQLHVFGIFITLLIGICVRILF